MESFLNRYRNITVLLLVIFAQLVLLALQVKNDQDVRVIRVWAVTTVTPVARVVEWFRGGSIGLIRHYILLHDASEENRKLREEVGRLRLQNNYLSNELNTAERAKALQAFQAHVPSKMLAANVIGIGAGSNSKVVFVNRGSAEGVMRGMAVVTPDGIVGKVIAAYPTASEVLLVTDPEFAAGVVSQKGQVRGTLKGQGRPLCKVDYVPFEEKVEPGEWFYTSGDDRVFPRGFAVGVVKVVGAGQSFKDIQVEPSGLQHGLEDVLIILESVHQAIPDTPPANQPVYIAPAPPAPAAASPASADAQPGTAGPQPTGTEADKLRSIYKSVGDAQNHVFGTGLPGSKPPDFTHLPTAPLPAGAGGQGPGTGGQSPTGSPQNTQAPAKKTGSAVAPGAQSPAKKSAAPAGASEGTPGAAPKSSRPAASGPAPQPAQKKSGVPAAGGRSEPASRTPAKKSNPAAGGAAPGGRSEPAPQTPANKSGPPAKGPGGAPRE